MPSWRSTSCRALAAEPVQQSANGTYDIEANTESHHGLRGIQTFAYCRPTIPQLLCCINFGFTCTTIACIIMTMRAFTRNSAGGDIVGSIARCRPIIFGVPRLPSVPVTSGHLQCTDTFAWSRGCPFMTGTTVIMNRLISVGFCGPR